jgi:transposase
MAGGERSRSGTLRHDRLTAPCVFDGPINGVSVRAYVDQILVPTLSPDDIVILDNLGSHKSTGKPQIKTRPRRHTSRRRPPLVPAEVLPRPQSDRATLL